LLRKIEQLKIIHFAQEAKEALVDWALNVVQGVLGVLGKVPVRSMISELGTSS
jgi:hypothetical protein